jgi:hypothetical protein
VVEENAFAVERLGPAREYGDASCLYCLNRLLLCSQQNQQLLAVVLLAVVSLRADWIHLPRFLYSQLCRLHDLWREQFDNRKRKPTSKHTNML